MTLRSFSRALDPRRSAGIGQGVASKELPSDVISTPDFTRIYAPCGPLSANTCRATVLTSGHHEVEIQARIIGSTAAIAPVKLSIDRVCPEVDGGPTSPDDGGPDATPTDGVPTSQPDGSPDDPQANGGPAPEPDANDTPDVAGNPDGNVSPDSPGSGGAAGGSGDASACSGALIGARRSPQPFRGAVG